MNKMYNIFKTQINTEDIKVIYEENYDTEYPISVEAGNLCLIDKFKEGTPITEKIPEIVKFYNEVLWNNYTFLTLMVRYTSHIKKYNNEGWKNREDFTTPETYEAFIKGIETAIRGYILELMNTQFTTIQLENDIHDEVISRAESLSEGN